jgi:hypothetical protein
MPAPITAAAAALPSLCTSALARPGWSSSTGAFSRAHGRAALQQQAVQEGHDGTGRAQSCLPYDRCA